MFQVFNTSSLSQKERFFNALLFGSLASIVLIVIYVFITNLMYEIGIEFAIAYIGFGFLIGLIVQKTGHGVQLKFAILAAVLCVFVIFFGDLFTFFPGLIKHLNYLPEVSLELLKAYFSGLSSLLSVAFRLFGVAMAFQTARIL